MTLADEQRNLLMEQYHSYIQEANQLRENKKYFQSTLAFAKAMALGELLDEQKLALDAKLEIAHTHLKARKPKEALLLYSELTEYKDLFSESDYSIKIQNNKGIVLFQLGRFQDAADIFEEVAKTDNKTAQRKAYNNMGVMYYYLHTFFEEESLDRAIQCFEKAYSLSTEDQLMRHKVLRNTGMAFCEKKDYSTALRKFKESLLLAEDKIELASTLNEMAKVYIGLRDYDQALQNLRDAEKILLQKDYRNLEELSRNIMNHGLLAKKQGRIESAFSHFRTALQGFVESENYPEAVLTCREVYKMFKDSKPERASFFLDQYQFYLNYLDPMET